MSASTLESTEVQPAVDSRGNRASPSWLSSGLELKLRHLRIGVRLRLVFVCVLLLMMTGGAVTVWQVRAIRQRVAQLSRAEQRATAALRVNNSVVILMSRLHRAADQDDGRQFSEEAARLLDIFRSETAAPGAVLREASPASGREKLMITSISLILDSIPTRIQSLVELARAGDWQALHARLTDQVDHSDEVGEQLMLETSQDLSQARRRLFEGIEEAQRSATRTLAVSSLLSLVVAGILGLLVTSSITRPLAALDQGALSVARGDFQYQLPILGSDEFARLSTAFNRMTRDLADLYARESEARKTAEHLNLTLQRANDDLSVFAYCASHDLQEPLRGIKLHSQMLRRKCESQLDPEAKEFLGYLVEDASRMSDLLHDLLAYIKISDGETLAIGKTSAASAIDIAVSNLRTAIAANEATVIYDDLPMVEIEPVHLQQLFQNLIGNAIKYRSDDPPRIRISATHQDGYWQFSVKDNGIGIDPRYRTQIFRIFQRLNRKSLCPGTGVGLAICQKIVERYGGQIWVQTSSGKGSDFRFTLPVSA